VLVVCYCEWKRAKTDQVLVSKFFYSSIVRKSKTDKINLSSSDDLDDSKIKQDDDEDVSMSSIPESSKKATPITAMPTEKPEGGDGTEEDKLPFPSFSDLNTRLRRIITGFQRNHKRMLIKNAQKVKVLRDH
jgi:hypothetical protein